MNNLYGKPEIIDWKVLSSDQFNASDITSVDLFIDKDNKAFVEAGNYYLWLNDKWVSTKQYGGCLNGFVRDGRVYMTSLSDEQHIDIYSVGKDFTFENRITIGDFHRWPGREQVIYVPGEKNTYYLLGARGQLPQDPGEFMVQVTSGGHGICYDKPIWAEVQGQKLLEYQEIPYGGKTDESYRIKEVLTGKDTVHFLGFRKQEHRKWGSQHEPPPPGTLHYAEYNVKNKKLVRSQDIYDNIPYKDENDKYRYFYWHVSADNFNGNIFIVFSWHGIRYYNPLQPQSIKTNMENINSPIYYSQSGGKTFSDAEVIGQGILPLVRADSVGNVHVIWADSNGNLVHKVKKDSKWGDEQIAMDGMIDTDKVWEKSDALWFKKMSAEFDKDKNLNVVFTSKGKLVLAKIKFD
jgi:hypothetical protein